MRSCQAAVRVDPGDGWPPAKRRIMLMFVPIIKSSPIY